MIDDDRLWKVISIINLILIQYLWMSERNDLERMYHGQNISMRKNIRELDLKLSQLFCELPAEKIKKSDINMIVVGPRESGKTNLIKYP